MRTISFPVDQEYDGVTLKGFLRGRHGLSSGLFAELKRIPGGLKRNGNPVIATDVLRAGDYVILSLPNETLSAEPVSLPLNVVYEDDDLLAVDKPSGMPMYPTPGHDRDSLANAFSARCAEAGETCAFRPVYRLDSNTTGLTVLAKNRYAASVLAGKVNKTYLAICEGVLRGEGEIDRPIGLKPGHTIQRAVRADGKRAVTLWHCLGAGECHSLISITLETGRTHQIRVHFSDIGHPLAGDDMYGGHSTEIRRHALHCSRICFCHPVTERLLVLNCPLPPDMAHLLNFFAIPFHLEENE